MSIIPPLKCPPGYSILGIRLTECKKIGVVKGSETLADVDLKDLFIPVMNFEEKQITLRKNEIRKIDVSSLGQVFPQKECYEFVANPGFLGECTQHSYSLFTSDLVLIETLEFMVPRNSTFVHAFECALKTSTNIQNLVTVDLSTFETCGKFTICAKDCGIKYRHEIEFDKTGFGGYLPFPMIHPGNLKVPYQKYKYPRIKFLMIYPDFFKANVYSGCGCTNSAGQIELSKRYVEYCTESEYLDLKERTMTPVKIRPEFTTLNDTVGFLWDFTSKDHIGYHFLVGDIMSSELYPNLRGVVTGIQGYEVTLDFGIGTFVENQLAVKFQSPKLVAEKWKKIGDIFVLGTAQELNVLTDFSYFETLVLKNPHSYDLPIKIILAV